MRKPLKIIAKTLFVAFIIIILFVISLLIAFVADGTIRANNCIDDQILRMEELRTSYASNQQKPINEQSFCDFDLTTIDTIKYNDLRTMATHNSYKKKQIGVSRFISKNFFPLVGQHSEVMNYQLPPLTEQLNKGIRSYEWDISNSKKLGFIMQHVSFIDNNTWSPDFKLALEELVLWSDNNPTHMPITILLELKNQELPNIGLSNIESKDFDKLNNFISNAMGDNLFTPKDMLRSYTDFSAMCQNNDYPTLDTMQGKVLFLIHSGDEADEYLKQNPKEVPLFAMGEHKNSCFAIENNSVSSKDKISDLLAQNYIIRTAADWFTKLNEENRKSAIASGCQILTTDFPINLSLHPQKEFILKDNFTMILSK